MKKEKKYQNAYFKENVIHSAIYKWSDLSKCKDVSPLYVLEINDETWRYNDEKNKSQFFLDYRKEHDYSTIDLRDEKYLYSISITYYKYYETAVEVKAPTREEIEDVFDIFEQHYDESIIKPPETEKKGPVIFIGHGRNKQWRDLKDHLSDKHGYKIEAYETGARAGHTIRDVLEDMSTLSTFALLVMTGEDEGEDGSKRARQNVIHEVGLFQGKLGFNRAIVLLEDGTEEFSNLYGIQQLRFSKDNIKETFGDVLATLKREFENEYLSE